MGIPKSVEQAREYSNNINNVDPNAMPQNEQNLAIRYALHDIAKKTGEAPAFNFDYSPVDYDDTLSSEIYKPYVNPLQDAFGMLWNAVPSTVAALVASPTLLASGATSLMNDALEKITGDDYDDPKVQKEKYKWYYDPAARGSIEWTNAVNDFFDSWKYKPSDRAQEKLDVTNFWATANPNNVAANIGNGIGSVLGFIGTILATKKLSGGSGKIFQGLGNASKAEILGSYMYMNNEVYNEFRSNAKIDDLTAAKLSSLVSLPIALSEYVGLSALGKVMTKPMVKNAIKGGVEEAIASYGTKGLTKELYQDFTAKAIQGIGNRMTTAALKGAEGAVIEGVQEYGQGKMQQAAEALYDKIANEKVFGTELFNKQALKDDVNNAFWGGAIGGLLGMGGGMINSKEMQESVFHYVGINLQKNRPAKIDGVKKFITQLGENGKITPEQTEQGIKMVDEMVAVHKEAMPLSLTDIDARYQAYEFIQAKNKIQADLLALDEKPVDPTLAKADSELRTIMEQSAEAYDEAIALIAKTKGQISESELSKKLYEIGTQFNKVEAPVEEVKTDITGIENKEELPTAETKKADISIGKIPNTEYEVKSDGVYYKGNKLDNPENKTHRQLIEADIGRRRQEELKSFTEREKESVKKSTKGTPINKDNPNSFKVGQEYNDGMLVIVQDVQTADNFDANIAENEGEGYTIIDRVLEYGEMKDGKQSKAPILRTRVFNNKEDADTYLEQQKQKFDSQIGKSRQYDKINAKYDAELDALEKNKAPKQEEVKSDLGKNEEMLKKAEKALKSTVTKIEQLKTQPLGAKESQDARNEKIANFEERKKQIETKIGELNDIREAETRVSGVEETGAVVETADTGVSAEEVVNDFEAKKADIERRNTFTRKDLQTISEGTSLAKKGSEVIDTKKVESTLSIGDKITFFAEKERKGIWDGKAVRDEKDNPWGLIGILGSNDGWLRNDTKYDAEIDALEGKKEEVRVNPDEVVAEVRVEPDVNEGGQDVQEDVQVEGVSEGVSEGVKPTKKTPKEKKVESDEEKKIDETKDTGLVDGINNIRSNEGAFSLFKAALGKGMIHESWYNDIGLELANLKKDKKDKVDTADVAEIIQKYSEREPKQKDDTKAREEQERINKEYETISEEIENVEDEKVEEIIDKKIENKKAPKRIYYKSIDTDGEGTFEFVEAETAKPIKLFSIVDAFYTKENGIFVISDTDSGAQIATGKTLKSAIKEAEQVAKSAENLMKVSKMFSEKNGLSPAMKVQNAIKLEQDIKNAAMGSVEQIPDIIGINALKDVESTAKALEGKNSEMFIPLFDVLGTIADSEYNKEQATRVIDLEIEMLPDDIKFANDKERQSQLKKRLEYLSDAKNKEKEVDELFKELEKDSLEKLANSNKKVAKAYHKAKADGSNPKLVKAVEQAILGGINNTGDVIDNMEENGDINKDCK